MSNLRCVSDFVTLQIPFKGFLHGTDLSQVSTYILLSMARTMRQESSKIKLSFKDHGIFERVTTKSHPSQIPVLISQIAPIAYPKFSKNNGIDKGVNTFIHKTLHGNVVWTTLFTPSNVALKYSMRRSMNLKQPTKRFKVDVRVYEGAGLKLHGYLLSSNGGLK
ncbi:hypothetical protein LguiA_004469 [Lonicera macranthoides]